MTGIRNQVPTVTPRLIKGLPRDGKSAKKAEEEPQIMLREKSPCEFVIYVSRKTGSSGMLGKIANRAYKARADWLNRFSYWPLSCDCGKP